MSNRLFCYGTLCFYEVMRRVCGSVPDALPANLHDYACYSLTGLPYPAILSEKGARVSGVLYLNLSQAQLVRLDAYEGEEYRRMRVAVTSQNGQSLQAWTYVLRPRYYHRRSKQAWSLEHFRRNHLADYLHRSHNKLSGMHGRDSNQSG